MNCFFTNYLICSICVNRMLDILEKFLIRKGYCFSRLDGSTPMSLRQSFVDDFNKSPIKQVSFWFRSGVNIHLVQLLTQWHFLIGVPCILCWWIRSESGQCKPHGNLWPKLESCTRFAGTRQIFPLWTKVACCCIPSSCCWFSRGTCLFSAGI